jgi:hypothetical protein
MSELKDCLKIKLDWEKCSTKLIIEDPDNIKLYQEKMNYCFSFYKKYQDCLLKK